MICTIHDGFFSGWFMGGQFFFLRFLVRVSEINSCLIGVCNRKLFFVVVVHHSCIVSKTLIKHWLIRQIDWLWWFFSVVVFIYFFLFEIFLCSLVHCWFVLIFGPIGWFYLVFDLHWTLSGLLCFFFLSFCFWRPMMVETN